MKYFYSQITKEDGIVMRGVVNTPDDFDENKKYPTVIIFHGFGGDRNGSVNFRINHAKYLTERGFVVFRFDFSGSGESDGSFYDMTVSREEKELEMIHDFAKMKYYVDKDRLYWIGHSLGGVLSSLMAYKLKPKAMVLLAPASDMNNKDYLKVMAKTVFEGEVSGKTKIESNMPYERVPAPPKPYMILHGLHPIQWSTLPSVIGQVLFSTLRPPSIIRTFFFVSNFVSS